ncbi:MAG: tetratricopeptide repeat protein [Ignavibacteriaceae bacterium]|nr:tetratricopeptide repeat protein [Ignavibacteriaceae bacterium]
MKDNHSTLLANSFVLIEIGNFKAATDTLEKLMDTLLCKPSNDNASEIVTLTQICNKIFYSGEKIEITFIQKLNSITYRYLGSEHPINLSTELQLASMLLSQGHNDRAEKIAVELLDKCEKILGKNDPQTVACAMILFGLYSQKEDIASGQALFTRIPGLQKAILQHLINS